MIFSELYGAYYNVMAKMLECAIEGNLNENKMNEIIEKYAFGESIIDIPDAIKNGRWKVVKPDFTTPVKNTPKMPLTDLEKRWLKSISLDERMKLFDLDFEWLDDIEPLFTSKDFVIFDKYSDGDDFSDEGYITRFKTILKAIAERDNIEITSLNRKGEEIKRYLQPKKLEYSPKDDKFRLIARGRRGTEVVNLQKIVKCNIYDKKIRFERREKKRKECFVTILVKDERKAVDRVLLHFAHFKKEAEQIAEKTYRITLFYDEMDETEIVIRILSFGPFVKVIEPESFVSLVKDRLTMQNRYKI